MKSKPPPRWVCDTCNKGVAKKRKIESASETIAAFKFQPRKQARPIVSDDDDSDDYSEAEVRKSQRNSLRRKRDSSPIITQSGRVSNSRRSRLSADLLLDHVHLIKLLDEVMKHRDAWPFLRPVIKSEVPDYYKVIKNPMDLAKVKSNLNTGKYSSNYEVASDLQLIFKNCDLYNQNGSDIYE